MQRPCSMRLAWVIAIVRLSWLSLPQFHISQNGGRREGANNNNNAGMVNDAWILHIDWHSYLPRLVQIELEEERRRSNHLEKADAVICMLSPCAYWVLVCLDLIDLHVCTTFGSSCQPPRWPPAFQTLGNIFLLSDGMCACVRVCVGEGLSCAERRRVGWGWAYMCVCLHSAGGCEWVCGSQKDCLW